MQSTLRNATDSSFLRLPPDIRNRIYHFALGSRRIHVRQAADGSALIYFGTCHVEEEYQHVHIRTWFLFIPNTSYHWHSAYARRHSDCTSRHHRSMLGPRWLLLLACRQIYQEAALIPFTSNTFTFEGIACLKQFLLALMPCQARALTRILLVVGELDIYALPKPLAIPDPMLADLTGLRSLVLVLGAHSPGPLSTQGYVDELGGSFRFLKLHRFRKLRLMKCKVQAEIELHDGVGPYLIRECISSWAESEEIKMLKWVKGDRAPACIIDLTVLKSPVSRS